MDIEGDLNATFPEVAATLRSLSPSPFDPIKEQIAIVTFNPVPIHLKESEDQRLQIRRAEIRRAKENPVECHFLSPLRGYMVCHPVPTAYAVGYNLAPLRG